MGAVPDIANCVYGGRTLVGHTEHGEHVAGWPEVTEGSDRHGRRH